MSGESVFQLLKNEPSASAAGGTPYTGHYEKHLAEPEKPAYSTFYEKNKEYDGTNVRFFKQREAIIGKDVSSSVQPSNFLKKGGGVRYVAPAQPHAKMQLKPPVDHGVHGHDLYHFADVDANHAGHFCNLPEDDGRRVPAVEDNVASQGLTGDEGDCGAQDGERCKSNNDDTQRGTEDRGAGADSLHDNGSAAKNTVCNDTSGRAPAYLTEHSLSGSGDNNMEGHSGDCSDDPFAASKNFVRANIVEVSNMVPRRRKLQPRFATDSEGFAKVPKYLDRVKNERATEEMVIRNIDEQKLKERQRLYENYVFRLSEAERQELVAKLRRKFETKTALYNKVPLAVNTTSACKAKGDLEKALRDIESALQKLDREAIFVYRDDPVNVQWTKPAALAEARQYAATRTQGTR